MQLGSRRLRRGTPCSPTSTSTGGRGRREQMTTVSFHFHGYQPGDAVRWIEPDPLKPPRFEERNSPVAVRIGGGGGAGGKWRDVLLRAYGRGEEVLSRE